MRIFLSTWRFLKPYLCLVVLVALCFSLSHHNNDSENNNSITANIYCTLTGCQAQAKCLHTRSHLIRTKLQWAEPLLSQFHTSTWRNEVRERLHHFPRTTRQENKLTQSTCLNFYTLLPPTWFHAGKLWQSKSRNKIRSTKCLILRKTTVKGALSMNLILTAAPGSGYVVTPPVWGGDSKGSKKMSNFSRLCSGRAGVWTLSPGFSFAPCLMSVLWWPAILLQFTSSDCSCCGSPGQSDCAELHETGNLRTVLEGPVRSGWWEMKKHQLWKGLDVGMSMGRRNESGWLGIQVNHCSWAWYQIQFIFEPPYMPGK